MIPKSLKLNSFMSHDNSEIDFSKFDVALVLGAYDGDLERSNGSGKSILLESMCWALFGKSRHKKKDGVVKWDRRACKVEFEFYIDNELYKIIRIRDKTICESDVRFSQRNGSSFEDISCDTNTATDNKIIETINFNYEIFINSVYFKQEDISVFATATAGKRKDIIKSLLKMDKWDTYQKKAKEYVKRITAQIEEKSQYVMPIQDIEKELERYKKDIRSLEEQIKSFNKEYKKNNKLLINTKSEYQFKYSNLSGLSDKLEQLQREFEGSKKQVKKIDFSIKNNENKINQSNKQIELLQEQVKSLKTKISAGKKIDIESLRSKILVGKTKASILKDTIHRMNNTTLSDTCDNCLRPLSKSDIIRVEKHNRSELPKIKAKLKEMNGKLTRAESKLHKNEQIVVMANKSEIDKSKIESKISHYQHTINGCVSENKHFKQERHSLMSRCFKNEIQDIQDRFNKDKKDKMFSKIKSLEGQVSSTKRKIDGFNVEYGSKVRKFNELIEVEQEQTELKKKLDILKGDLSIYSKLRDYFGKDGVQAVIIENVIEELEGHSNNILSKICNEPTSISVQTQKQNDNGSWTETFDIIVKDTLRSDSFETYSVGEKFRVSLALRLALSKILSERMGGVVKFLLLDEVSSSLDVRGLEMFMDIVKRLGKDMKIMVITHDDRLKEKFDDVIVVDKTVDGSKVSM